MATLDNDDLSAIDKLITKRVTESEKRLKININMLDKKFDKLFNFLDKDVTYFKRKAAKLFNVNVSEFNSSTD